MFKIILNTKIWVWKVTWVTGVTISKTAVTKATFEMLLHSVKKTTKKLINIEKKMNTNHKLTILWF